MVFQPLSPKGPSFFGRQPGALGLALGLDLDVMIAVPVKMKVLVAEDDEMLLGLFVRWLEAAGYWVVRARDGERALDAVRETKPEAVVMDLTMPRLDGFQVLTALKEMGLTSVPILVLTGRQSMEDVRKAISLGAKDYLTKPVDKTRLLGRLERLLNKPPAAQRHAAAG